VELGDTTQCILKGELHIKVHPLPVVDFKADPPLYYAQGDSFSVQFYDQSTVYNPPASYSWDFGNQTYANQQNPVAIFQDTGTYSVQLQLSDSFACSSQLSKSIHIDVTTIKGNDAENRIRIYPNPTDDKLFIKSTIIIKELRLINSLGKEVWHEYDLTTREYQLDSLPKGLYFVEILDIQGKLTQQKVVFY
jgi:PKD repeat protein